MCCVQQSSVWQTAACCLLSTIYLNFSLTIEQNLINCFMHVKENLTKDVQRTWGCIGSQKECSDYHPLGQKLKEAPPEGSCFSIEI